MYAQVTRCHEVTDEVSPCSLVFSMGMFAAETNIPRNFNNPPLSFTSVNVRNSKMHKMPRYSL